MVFVADDLGAWLVALLADTGRKKLTTCLLGNDQERALRKAATAAVALTDDELGSSDGKPTGQLAMVVSERFEEPIPGAPLTGQTTLLQALQAGIAEQLAILDDPDVTGTGQSSADLLGVPASVLAETLAGHLVREIIHRGSGGGPLEPLADQLNHDATYLQGQRIESKLDRLADEVLAACAQAGNSPAVAPTTRVRVSEADPRRLGVHAAISVPGVSDDAPPEYVRRDVDTTEFGIQSKVTTAAKRGGFVLLVGGSSVGKTRSAAEAVTALLPDWWLVHPADPAEVATLARAPALATVVWLDELQRYLDGEHGLTGGMVRALLNAPHPAVIIGTLWPDLYTAYTTVPTSGSADPHARERQVLDLADVVRIDPAFSSAEQDRARAAAARDRRLWVAIEAAEYGLTQTLAAAPQLVARWEDAQTASPYGWAVLTAALDAARLGVRAPLSADLLRAAAPGYCTSQQQAKAPEDWFDQALTYATRTLHGAAAALSPTGAGIMGLVTGYTVADYLVQHANRERRYTRVPASTWDAVLSHLRDSTDTIRLADSARSRMLYRYAVPLYRQAADAGDPDAALELARLLADRGDLDGLRVQADAGDRDAARRLADLLADRGDLDGLRARADAGDRDAARRLADLSDDRGDLDGLRARADAGDRDAARRLADLLADRGDLDGLRTRADAGDPDAAEHLTDLLARRGDLDGLRARANADDGATARGLADLLAARGGLDEAVQILSARADVGDRDAVKYLADLLTERGDLDRAVQILWARTNVGDRDAAEHLTDLRRAGLLAERSDLDEAVQILSAQADAGDRGAAERLIQLLARRGDLDGLRVRADAGDRDAARRLAGLLAVRGDLDGLRLRANAGDQDAAERLAGVLIKQGRGEEAERLRRFGLNPDGSIACV